MITIMLTQIPTLNPAPKILPIAWQLLRDEIQKNKITDRNNGNFFILFLFIL